MAFDFNVNFNDFRINSPVTDEDGNVSGDNSAPIATNDIYNGISVEDGPVELDVLNNDSDPDQDDLEISEIDPIAVLEQPVNGSVRTGNGSVTTDGSTVTFTPNPNSDGVGGFSYDISDGKGGDDSAIVEVTTVDGGTAGPTNEVPTISDQGFTVDEDGTGAPFTVAASDNDGSIASFAIKGGNDPDDNGTDAFAIDDDGQLTVVNPGELTDGTNDPYALDVEVTDNEGATATGTVTVDIDPADDSPQPENLDDLGGTVGAAATFDAGPGSFEFTDSVVFESNTVISNYGDDDNLVFDEVTPGDVSVESAGGSTSFSFDDGQGTTSEVELAGVGGFFFDVNSFNAASDFGDVTFA